GSDSPHANPLPTPFQPPSNGRACACARGRVVYILIYILNLIIPSRRGSGGASGGATLQSANHPIGLHLQGVGANQINASPQLPRNKSAKWCAMRCWIGAIR